jgi:hypothetical protein
MDAGWVPTVYGVCGIRGPPITAGGVCRIRDQLKSASLTQLTPTWHPRNGANSA